jgi:GTPase SAR1 family protein
MPSSPIEGDSLDQLQTPEQVKLLDTIDNFRNLGLGHYNISLPQLIVCGDQSSGKSSVLEGLTRLRFPTKDGLCTTFATELVLRKDAITSILCTVIPGKDRSPAEKGELSKFKRAFASPDDFAFPDLLAEARSSMAFGARSDRGPFFEDILQIRYSGPELPSLTIVDLPGIISFHHQGSKAVHTVRDLVQSYMADKSSIILAIVSAKSDYENQGVLDYVKQFDPTATRTLGIITKPDFLDSNTDSEKTFIKLAKNLELPLSLGWHAVKNRGFGMENQSDKERDESETRFFNNGSWASLPRTNVGITTLRSKLSRVLLQHIRQELPSLSAAILNALKATEDSLKGLGQPRDEQQQQRSCLMNKADQFQLLTRDALRGIYTDNFFKTSTSDIIPPARLRTRIQDLNIAFAHTMYCKGHYWQVMDGQFSLGQGYPSHMSTAFDNYQDLREPENIERARFLDEVVGARVRLSRSSGLLSITNPWVIGEIFREQAQPWEAIARRHLEEVYDAVNKYLNDILSTMMDDDMLHALLQEHIEPELQRRWHGLSAKLNELLLPFQNQEPILYDPSLAHDLSQIRTKRYFEQKSQFTLSSSQKNTPMQLLTDSEDDFSNCDILHLVHNYYKVSLPLVHRSLFDMF